MIMTNTATRPRFEITVNPELEELKYSQEFKLETNSPDTNDEIRQIIRKVYNRPDMSNELITTYLRAYSVYKKEYLERL